MPRHLHLAAFASAGPVSGSHGGWRHPDASGDLLSAGYYQNLGRLLEEGRFDMVFLADILAVPDRLGDSLDSQLRYGALGALRLEPLLVLAIIAGATQHVGLACTVSTTYAEPFAAARALATLDHLSNGRAAWNIVTSFQEAEARNFGRVEQLAREERYDRADEFMEVTCRLWDSWEDGALTRDKDTPLFADPSRVHRIDHAGRWFDVRGPLNVSRSPQGRPVFVQAGASDRGRDFAARWAEVIFVTPGGPEAAREFRLDLRARAERFGRSPDHHPDYWHNPPNQSYRSFRFRLFRFQICGKLVVAGSLSQIAERSEMELDKVITYSAIGVAGIVLLIFLLDLAAGIFGRQLGMDILFILGSAFLLWQGVETVLELK